jgi:hypothetical protein
MGFEIIKDLVGGSKPQPMDLPYNGSLAADNTTTRYKGSLVKLMDIDDIDHGAFLTFAGLTTALENMFGILEEEVTDGYLFDDATYGFKRYKITPIFPSSVIRGEYGRADAAGTANYDTGATASAAGTTLTISVTTADRDIGGWVYMINGANAGFLSYVTNNTTAALTTATAFPKAVVATDDFLFIQPPNDRLFLINATYTGFTSEVDDGARTCSVALGLDHYISAPGIGLQKLDRNLHDGIIVSNARFYHDFVFTGMGATAGGPNMVLFNGVAAAS